MKNNGDIEGLLAENERRLHRIRDVFNPVTGEGSVGERFVLELEDFPLKRQWLPSSMRDEKLVRWLVECGSVAGVLEERLGTEPTEGNVGALGENLLRLRLKHDFAFWAATQVKIHPKEGGEAVPFVLNRPQREKLLPALEKMRLNGEPIRLILLKARQWGGSTAIQLYMAWLQLIHKKGLNSVIVAQTKKTSFAIRSMYDRALESYALELLHEQGEKYDLSEPRMVNVGLSADYKKIPQRDCTITIASYEAPDALRGDAYSLVHCSEVGLWNPTEQKSPDSIVRSACSGILYKPLTMIVYESTANGTGNFFQREYDAAKDGVSQFSPLFVSWFDIDQYSTEFPDDKARRAFARRLLAGKMSRMVGSTREESGSYLWSLWERGATLEAINWYVKERSAKDSHAVMAAEYPSDDVEAFVHSGMRVFDRDKVELLKKTCKPPKLTGEVYADGDSGREAFVNLRFTEDSQGLLEVWSEPEIDDVETVTDRYLTVVDIGGRWSGADWSVIVVFDRLFMESGGKPSVAAQWRGHVDMDILAWKAAQISAWYDNALLVIESNTLETHDRQRSVDGDQSLYILNQLAGVYDNLYARPSAENSVAERPATRYGFHTNIQTKPMVISTLIKAVRDEAYVERDKRCVDEYLTYEKKQNGSFGAIAGKHDDLLMTRAIGLHVCFNEMPLPRTIKRADRKPSKRKGPSTAATL